MRKIRKARDVTSIKYWNRKRGEYKVNVHFDDILEFFEWMRENNIKQGRFYIKIKGGYAKNKEEGVTSQIDFYDNDTESLIKVLCDIFNIREDGL